MTKKPEKKNIAKTDPKRFAIPKRNVYKLLIGLGVIALGFILLAGGGTKDPNVFTGEKMFNFTRMVVAPILICAGFAYQVVAIMVISKRDE